MRLSARAQPLLAGAWPAYPRGQHAGHKATSNQSRSGGLAAVPLTMRVTLARPTAPSTLTILALYRSVQQQQGIARGSCGRDAVDRTGPNLGASFQDGSA